MINEFTEFSAGAITTIVALASKVFMKHWYVIFGVPWSIFSDNDGEFTGDSFTNIKIQTTPSKS